MRRWMTGLGLGLALAVGPALADQADGRLPGLFDRLRQTQSAREAAELQQTIWAIWIAHGNAMTNLTMLQGITAMNQGDFPAALEAFDQLVATAPTFAEAWNKRATLHFLMGNYPASIADIGKTLELEPHHWGALSGLGQIYLEQGDADKALAALTKALEINPHLDGARVLLERARKGSAKGRI